ncbi:hypothetical protein [Deinococcus knuensis]|uniref:ArsR family transcriptional regulator n=1 Tax=Deinococcus knuensis TaxID=1837380 RepID=A0ABQ2SE79_9DEIO|nr:hypothetical protein [Deinococcus knuensis]GGS17064.1 hypothetical protein GCM10008961_05900 [Deinococcus knuensis]
MSPQPPVPSAAQPAAAPLLTAQTPEQARLLLNPAYQRTLGAVMNGKGGAAAVAADTGVTLTRTHHRLTRLLAAGLIEVARVRARAGRGVKEYRAVAAEYRVPLELTDASDLEELLGEALTPFMQTYQVAAAGALRRMGRGHEVQLIRNSHGEIVVNFAGGTKPAFSEYTFGMVSEMTLRPGTLAELEARVQALQEWVSERHREDQDDPGARPALLGLLLTPGKLPEG